MCTKDNTTDNVLDLRLLESKETEQRIKQLIRHGHLNMGSYSDDIDVTLWLPEMNGVNVTIFCDRFIEKHNAIEGYFLLITGPQDLNCLSVLNIEEQSSGFKLVKQVIDRENAMLILQVCPDLLKKELIIPDDCWSGFAWGDSQQIGIVPSHKVPVEQYKNKYILNFSVSGEFNLEIYYLPKDNDAAVWLFGKSFCCK